MDSLGASIGTELYGWVSGGHRTAEEYGQGTRQRPESSQGSESRERRRVLGRVREGEDAGPPERWSIDSLKGVLAAAGVAHSHCNTRSSLVEMVKVMSIGNREGEKGGGGRVIEACEERAREGVGGFPSSGMGNDDDRCSASASTTTGDVVASARKRTRTTVDHAGVQATEDMFASAGASNTALVVGGESARLRVGQKQGLSGSGFVAARGSMGELVTWEPPDEEEEREMALKKEERGSALDTRREDVGGGMDAKRVLVGGGGILVEREDVAKGCLSRGRRIKKMSVSWEDGIGVEDSNVEESAVGGREATRSGCGLGGGVGGGDEGFRGRRNIHSSDDDEARGEGAGSASEGIEWGAAEQGEDLDQWGKEEGGVAGQGRGEGEGEGKGGGEGDSGFAVVQDKLASLQSRMDALQMQMRQARRKLTADDGTSPDQASKSARGGGATWRVAMSLSTARCGANALVIAGGGAQLHDG
jgi:hypothetical protein